MARRIVMIACLTLGIGRLVGWPWGLIVMGLLVEFAWPREQRDWRLTAAGARVWDWGVNVAATVRAAPRRGMAAALMVTAMVAVPVGVLLAASLGAALIVAGMVAGGVSLLVGWNT